MNYRVEFASQAEVYSQVRALSTEQHKHAVGSVSSVPRAFSYAISFGFPRVLLASENAKMCDSN